MMEKTAAILISRENNHIIVHSYGIFLGYGAYVAIDPFILLDSNWKSYISRFDTLISERRGRIGSFLISN